MASIAALVKSYRERKIQALKLKKQSENKLKEALSTKRRSTSGLAAIERKKEDLARQREHILQLLNQHLSQRESIERLRVAAEERLRQEQDARDQAKQQSEYGSTEDKTASVERLKYIDEKIAELHNEIKEREATQARLVKVIESYEKDKAKIDQQIKRQVQAKPALVAQLKASTSQEVTLRPRFQSLVKREAQASKVLETVQKRLVQLAAQKRKTRKKIKRKAKSRVRKAKRRIKRVRRIKRRLARRQARKVARRTIGAKIKSRTKKAQRRKILNRKTKRKSSRRRK